MTDPRMLPARWFELRGRIGPPHTAKTTFAGGDKTVPIRDTPRRA
jgi:hypothetical protein